MQKKVKKAPRVVVVEFKKPWGSCRAGSRMPMTSAEAKELIDAGKAVKVE